MEIVELEKKFSGRGEVKDFHFFQLQMTEKGYLYLVKIEQSLPHYEVFKRKVSAPHPMAEDKRDKVRYPNANAFGVWAWSYNDLKDAEQKLYEL